MRWDEDAKSAMAKAPLFIRKMITKRLEDYVRGQGRDVVTLADINDLRARDKQAPSGEMPAEQIEKIVRTSGPRVLADERTYEVKICSSPGCPRALFDVERLAQKAVETIEASRVPEAVTGRVKGPILRHHRLSLSISGCPNSCSQPQIADFGVQGRVKPAVGPGVCNGCGACVRVCSEDAIAITPDGPAFDAARCINCGDCARVCHTQAIVNGESGFSVLIGGKLGRHPQLAHTLFDLTDEQTLLTALKVTCGIFADDLQRGERLANAVDRIGIEEIARRIGAR